MKTPLIAFVTTLLFLSCNQINNKIAEIVPKDSTITTTTIITNDTISEIRTTVHKQAIASYTENTPGASNNPQLVVKIYETPNRFRFSLDVQYRGVPAWDTLKIPNFGIEPVVSIQKGKEPLSCIIGFNDKKGVFRPYKQVSLEGSKLKITILNRYFAGAYSTPQKP